MQELKRLLVLDSPEEAAYDEIVRLAATMAGAPIALISLIDEHRQWFKARVGLQVQETPKEQAFCAVAIERPEETMIVRDALEDPRFASNPLVTDDPGIRFYAGAPLVTSSGHALGTICVIDTQPRDIAPEQLEQLKFLAQQVITLLEARVQGTEASTVAMKGG